MKTDIKDLIENICEIKISEIDENTDLVNAGIIDSLMMMELLDAIEEKYDIEVDGEDIIPENFDTIVHIEALIRKSGYHE